MSYQVLARKWRPKSFATLVGQEHVVRALTHALEQQRLHHAYLFTGTRGVGKTTIARIVAKALNCEQGITAEPCGLCTTCVEIDAGRFIDLIEVDAATNTKVDEMRQLLENASYAPTRGRYKVYVIDEVHMLSNSAFNAMLKTLEEPPEHIKFILATTDPQKIPVTVLSRCLQFNLKQMPVTQIVSHLARILAAEEIDHEPAALQHLAKAAAGSMRDALSLLDQAIAHGAGRVEEENVRDMLGVVGDDYLYALLDALQAGDVAALLAVVDDMEMRSLSFDSALQELATLLHRIALLQMLPQALIDTAERQRLQVYAAHEQGFDAEFLQLAYQICIHGRDDLPLAPDERTGFAMTLLRLHAFRPEMPALPSRLKEAGTTAGKAAAKMTHAIPSAPSAPSAPPAPPAPSEQGITPPAAPRFEQTRMAVSDALSQPEQQSSREMAKARTAPSAEPVHGKQADAPQTQFMSAEAVAANTLSASALPLAAVSSVSADPAAAGALSESRDWIAICERLKLAGPVKSLAQHCELLELTEEKLVLRLPPAQQLLLGKSQEKLEAILQGYYGRPLRLQIQVAETTATTPAEFGRQQQQVRQTQAEQSVQEDAYVQDLIKHFDATLDVASIKPI